jgi:hypothetical protein
MRASSANQISIAPGSTFFSRARSRPDGREVFF